MGVAAKPILVVDDSGATRYATSRILRAQDYEVIEAESGTQAIQMAELGPSLILLDVHLPDLSGFDVCKEIRKIKKCATIPIIHISATYVNDSDKVQGLDSGADAYLVHPLEPTVLVATIQAFLRARKAEQAQRESEAKFKVVFDQSNTFTGITDLKGLVTEVNRAALERCGYTREQVLGKPFWETPWWRGSAEVQAKIYEGYRMCLEGRVYSTELPYWLQDGTERMADFAFNPAFDEAGDLIFLVPTGVDITYRKRAEMENAQLYHSLKEADRKKDEFLATLAHELRNPLAPLRNGIHILQLDDHERVHESVIAIMDRQLTHLVRLVDDLLDVSRITTGKVDLQVRTVSLRSLLESALETSMPSIQAKEHQVILDLPHETVLLDADPVRLSQVFSNLLNNAARYTSPNGQIWLRAAVQGDTVEVQVADNGIGIPSNHQSEVFEIFTQIEGARGQSTGGLGLGLALSKSLVELHGGTIQLESVESKGTTVFVRLPLSKAQAESPENDLIEGSSERDALKILVVDDSPDNSRMLSTLIRQKGHEVQTAGSGSEAMDRVEAFSPHLAFVDIGLPDMSGREVAVLLRQKFGEGIKLVALTGYGRDVDKQMSRDAGFDIHITKPASIAELENLIGDIAEKPPVRS